MDSPLKAAIIPVTPFQQNCTLLWCTETMRAGVVDPGGDLHRIEQAITEQNVTLERILITHGHIDHAGAAAELAERFGVPIEGPQKENSFWIDKLATQGAEFGLTGARVFAPDRRLDGGDKVGFGNVEMDVIYCPGHTPGHVVFFEPTARIAIVGDVLFQGSIGRTDFPRGDHATLINSIRNGLWPLGDDVTFVPGHGAPSTFGDERRSNPFVGDSIIGNG